MVMLPSLSQRLRGILMIMAAKESDMVTEFRKETGFCGPELVKSTGELVEETLIKIMEEIEKGPGPFPWH